MISFGNIYYFWFAIFLSVFLFALNIFTLKRIGFFRYRDIIRSLMWSGIVLFLGMIISEAKIEWKNLVPVKEKMEIIFAIDASLSALALDIEIKDGEQIRKISRLDFEKQQVENVIRDLSGDAIGITVFADRAIPLQIILSREDYQNSILRNLRHIDKDFVRFGIKHGTDYGMLILAALEQFGKNNKKKILFIMTDGEQQGDETKLHENIAKALQALGKRDDISIRLVGVGNIHESSKVPKLEDENGNPKEYYRYPDSGEFILTRPDPEFLAKLANMTQGGYLHTTSNQDLRDILKNSIEGERRIIGFEQQSIMIDLTPYLLIGSLMFLFLIPIIKSV